MILSLDVFQNGRKIGVGDGTFTTTRVTGSGPNAVVESQGIFTLRLRDGQLSIQFIQLRDNEQILPVAVTGAAESSAGPEATGLSRRATTPASSGCTSSSRRAALGMTRLVVRSAPALCSP